MKTLALIFLFIAALVGLVLTTKLLLMSVAVTGLIIFGRYTTKWIPMKQKWD